jgi:serine/threonine protein kinase/sugar lactone lactonase YvrE
MDNWQKVREVFDAALRQQPEERERYLNDTCGHDEDLLKEVESLFSSLTWCDDFLETPAVAHVADVIHSDRRSLERGTRFGHYEIIKQIGAGGMGEVYLAHDLKLGRHIAIKTLHNEFRNDGANLARFIGEAKAASALNYPNILVIHEIGESEIAHYIVSEFIEGRTLREICTQSHMSLGQVLDVSIQIADALCAAHGVSLVHRDIKPENVMVRPDGYVKVLDFGLAKLVTESNKPVLSFGESTVGKNQTGKGLILGTVNYMSPEQAKGEELDERTDIFSIGAVIYEMITGNTPFGGESMSETFANLINAEPQPLSRFASNVPAELQRIVSKTLRKNKDERYQTMKGLLAALKDVRENLTVDQKLEKSDSLDDHVAEISRPTTPDTTLQTAETTHGFLQEIKQHNALAAFGLVIFLAGVLIWLWYAGRNDIEPTAPILSAIFSSETLSTNGKVGHAVVSSDGKNVVYISGIRSKQSIWLRELESANNREIIPASDDVYRGLALSPDGNSLYFVRRPKDAEAGAIYRVSISGGIPTQIISAAGSWMNISPDGQRISFVRGDQLEDEECSLWIADAMDGKHEQQIASRQRPIRIGASAFSPDSKSIAFAVGQSDNAGNEFGLMELNFERGVEREITSQKFFNIKHIAWLPNQSGLLLTASVNPDKNFRIWQVSTASGQASPLTNDSETYSTLSLNKDASVLVSTKVKADFRLQLFNTGDPSRRLVLADARRVAFAPDGKVIFSSAMFGSSQDIWSARADGSEQRQLTNDVADDSTPTVSPDNSFIFFASNRTGQTQVWRMNADGSNQTQLTQKEGGSPLFVSPNGKWIYYQHSLNANLWRASATGGDEQLVLDRRKYFFAISPDGLQAAFSETHAEERNLTIVSLTDGRPIKTFRLGDRKAYLLNIAWLPDGRNLAYILANKEYENNSMWRQSLDGGHPQQITSLGDEMIVAFAIAPDGKSFAIVQGVWRGDAVLLRGLR